MRRGRRLSNGLLAAFAVGVLVGTAGCTAVAPADPTPGGVETPAASPTPTVMIVAGGDRPPAIVENCTELISVEELSAAVGTQVQAFEMLETDEASANLGAVLCGWSTAEHPDVTDAGALWVMPRAGMDPQEFAALSDISGYACLYGECTALVGGTNVVVGSTVPDDSYDAEEADAALATAERIGGAVLASIGDDPGPWVRDRQAWVGAVDCEAVGAALGDAIGRDIRAWNGLGFDPPRLWGTAADHAARLTSCEFEATDEPGVSVVIETDAGMAWTVPEWVESQGFSQIDGGGTADVMSYTNGDGYFMSSDGVNRVRAYYVDWSGLDPGGQARVADTFPPGPLNETAARILEGEFAT